MENKRQTGSRYEKKAAAYLEEQGYRMICMNYRCRFGEIDIIAQDGDYLVFVEVKYRADSRKGLPQEAVDKGKQRVICRVADYYCMTHGCSEAQPCRFDVAAILGEEITLFKNAFSYSMR